MNPIYKFFGGRTTFFVFWFFVVSAILVFTGKLNGLQWLGVAGALQTLQTLRAAAEDAKEVALSRQNTTS